MGRPPSALRPPPNTSPDIEPVRPPPWGGQSYKVSGANPIKLFDLSSNQKRKPKENKFASLAARAVFVSLFFLKKLIYKILAEMITLTGPIPRGV